ncbi:MAG: Hsp20/alpha crystallin family protein [Phycisphaerae bacterium]|nr:Hsp20/alpha crystallin family protein [Phycisphaerae bacterium]
MALVKKDRSDLNRLHNDIDDLFSSFFRGWELPWTTTRSTHAFWPALDVQENENEITVKAEIPGCNAEDVDISVHGNLLTISGEKKQEEEKEGKGYYYVERSYGSFRRDVNLPSEVDTSKIDASCKNGVLNIKLPKVEKAKAIKVKIKGE